MQPNKISFHKGRNQAESLSNYFKPQGMIVKGSFWIKPKCVQF